MASRYGKKLSMPPPIKRLKYTSASFSEAPMSQPADNGPGNRVKSPQDEHG